MKHALDWSEWVHVPLPLHRSLVQDTPSDVHAVLLEALLHADVLVAD